jgi:hypothetical protein
VSPHRFLSTSLLIHDNATPPSSYIRLVYPVSELKGIFFLLPVGSICCLKEKFLLIHFFLHDQKKKKKKMVSNFLVCFYFYLAVRSLLIHEFLLTVRGGVQEIYIVLVQKKKATKMDQIFFQLYSSFSFYPVRFLFRERIHSYFLSLCCPASKKKSNKDGPSFPPLVFFFLVLSCPVSF